ncbi:hybrid sensor histidine kinase/response regulator [Magnetospirillum molischianum]|nr:ATP-binding protein [Magnetospirillum molischianum]
MISSESDLVLPRSKLLIVDDQPSNLAALRNLLMKVDVEVMTASSGNEALKLCLNHDFALVLLDVQMPEIDGYEVAELMRGEEQTCDIPIIFLTAVYRDDVHRRRGYGVGAVDYIEKPIDEMVLLSKVRVFIELHRSHAESKRLLGLLTEANRSLSLEVDARRRSEADNVRLAGTIFDSSAEAIMVCDSLSRVIAVNPAFCLITGFSSAEIEGRNPRVMGSGRQNREFYTAMWIELEKDGKWQGELWNRRKNGEVYPVWLSIVLIRGEGGAIDKYVGIFSDITERKKAERELMESRLVAEEANRAKSHFLANVSHEFRTPLNAILGFSELLMIEGETNGFVSRHREYAASIHDSGQHLLELVNDLLDLSKIEAGKWVLHPGLFAVAPLVHECARLLQADAETVGIRIGIKTERAPPALFADKRAVRQSLINLLSNAVKFTPAGGVVTVEVDADGPMTVIRVSDTGIGIDATDVPRLMRPFEQADSSQARPSKGGGLGLAVVRSLVDLHRGWMRIESVVGKGTTVTIAFPTAWAEYT